jgi:ATP-binding cassette, subfamily A (ABC1), member 3
VAGQWIRSEKFEEIACSAAKLMFLQMRAVTRKNLTITCRDKRGLIREAGVPILLLAILVIMRLSLTDQVIPESTYPRKGLWPIEVSSLVFNRSKVFVAPSTSCFGALRQDTCVAASNAFANAFATRHQSLTIITKGSEADATAAITSDPNATIALVAIDDPGPLAGRLQFQYRIRLDEDALASGASADVSSNFFTGPSSSPSRLLPMLVPVQQAVTQAAVAAAGGVSQTAFPTGASVQQFPFPQYTNNIAASALKNVAPIYLVLVFSMQVRVMLQAVLEEKEKKVLEGMRMAGLSDAANWCGWLLTASLKNGLIVAVVVVVAKVGGIYEHSDVAILLLLFLTFAATAVAFTAAMSTLFSQARTGGAVGMLVYILASLPGFLLESGNVAPGAKIGVSVLAPTGFHIANTLLITAEAQGTGITWENVADPHATTLNVSMASLMAVIAGDIALYIALAWYLGKVVPNEYGTTLPPYFCFTRLYWSSDHTAPEGADIVEHHASLLKYGSESSAAATAASSGPTLYEADPHIEAVPEAIRSRECIRIEGLSKTYPSGGRDNAPVRALDHLSVEFWAGEITAFLGPNGSGKSTTMHMLCGLFPSTSGDATVLGHSVKWDISGVRRQLGVCPQHDVLLDWLTVREHLLLWGGIRGIEGEELDRQVHQAIKDVGLETSADDLSKQLSGGQKRRLSLAMAVMGDPPVLLLDEPTSGCDAAVRRKIWELLVAKRKAGRVIVLSSHDMAECEVLGDRVCILARGKLRVAGTTRFLKKQFGVGYHLQMTVHGGVDPKPIVELARKHVPMSFLETEKRGRLADEVTTVAATDVDEELAVTLPLDAKERFPDLFDDLDSNAESLGIKDYGLETTTLEEAFMRLVTAVEVEQTAAEHSAAVAAAAVSPEDAPTVSLRDLGRQHSGDLHSLESEPTSSAAAVASKGPASSALETFLGDVRLASRAKPQPVRQIRATITRRWLQTKRDIRSVYLQCLLPIVFAGISAVFTTLQSINAVPSLTNIPFDASPLKAGIASAGDLSLGVSQLSALPTSLSVPFWVNHVSPSLDITGWLQSVGPNLTTASGGVLSGVDATASLNGHNSSSDDVTKYLLSHQFQAAALVGDTVTASLTAPSDAWSLTLMYNTSFGSVLPVMVQALSNAILQSEGQEWKLSGSLDPLPRNVTGFTENSALANVGQYIAASLVGLYTAIGFSVIPGLQAINVVKERESKTRAVQGILGLRASTYWLGMWIWDALPMYSVPLIGATVVTAATGAFKGPTIPAVMLLLLFYGVATPGMAYTLSFAFETAASAQTWVMLITMFSTIVSFFASFILEYPGLISGDQTISQVLSYLFQILIPSYSLAKGLADVGTKTSCDSPFATNAFRPDCVPASPWDWNIAGSKICLLALSAPLWYVAILLIERARDPSNRTPTTEESLYKDPPGAIGVPMRRDGRPSIVEDKDVRDEALRVTSGRAFAAHDPIIAKRVRKVYRGAVTRVAVGDVSVAVPDGVVFGLLGPNGAGKSTLQSILVGDLQASAGDCSIDGKSIGAARNGGPGGGGIGYCPQFDALIPELSGEETLRFYSEVRGIPPDEVAAYIDQAIKAVDIESFRSTLSKSYSGGNKRKLSMALAYLGAPRVVFLDEASAGVDPVARRALWRVVWEGRIGRATVVTTHLLEEAAQLCSRIGILVSGRMACLGSTQHLKAVYGQGLQVDVEAGDMDALMSDFRSRLPSGSVAKIKEQHGGYARLEIKTDTGRPPLSLIFRCLLERPDVSDFTVTQTSLENIFLQFAKVQDEADSLIETAKKAQDSQFPIVASPAPV